MYALDDIAVDAANFRLAVQQGQPYKPLYVKLKLVWTCNLRCAMCNHWRDDRDHPLELRQFKPIIDDLAALGCRKIHVSGGEPTLYPELPDLVRYITGHGIRVNMTTNGTLLTRDRARALAEAGLTAANISIDSPDPRLHDKIRGVKGSWKRTVKGFRRLRRRLKKGNLRLNTVVGRLNYASLVGLPELAAELGANGLNLIPLDDHTGKLSQLNKHQIRDYNARIAPVIAEKGLALGLFTHPGQAYPFGQTPDEVNLSRSGEYALGYYDRHPCFAPWTHALIDHVGLVKVCCMLRDKPVLGDLRQQSFREVWEGATYAALRDPHQLPLFAACRRCDDFLAENQQMATLLQVGLELAQVGK